MPAARGTVIARVWTRRSIVMGTEWRPIPARMTMAALTLLAVASFMGPLAPPVAGAIIGPTEVESPIQRGGADLSA